MEKWIKGKMDTITKGLKGYREKGQMQKRTKEKILHTGDKNISTDMNSSIDKKKNAL